MKNLTIIYFGHQYHLVQVNKWWIFSWNTYLYSSGILENVEEKYSKILTEK